MSWSINLIGTPEKVAEALTEESGRLTGQSKVEYDAALPNMLGILALNKGGDQLIKVSGNGHAYDGFGYCGVTVETIPGKLV